jgi:hypothetical protein
MADMIDGVASAAAAGVFDDDDSTYLSCGSFGRCSVLVITDVFKFLFKVRRRRGKGRSSDVSV